jgi:shikimate kinase
MNLFLIGYRGTGKSTVGRLISQRLDLPFIDSDDEIERRAGLSIAEIFASEGESGFRDRETEVIQNLATHARTIVALGGGSVLRETNQNAISPGRVVWLQADPATIHQRVSSDQSTAERRPNLTVGGGFDEIVHILQQREPIYKSCANVIIDTEAKVPEQIADEVMDAISPEFE